MSLNNEKKIWDFLKSKGLNDYGCAGAMGNLYSESGLEPNNLENIYNKSLGMTDDEYSIAVDNGSYTKEQFVKDCAGWGICQWTYHTRKKALYEFAKSKNKSIADLDMQLEFFYKELSEGYTSVLKTLKTATSILEASNAVLLKYERPADQSVSVQNKRASFGQNYYNKYAKKGSDVTMGVKTYQESIRTQLSKNFNSYEFRCGLGRGCSCTTTLIDDKLWEYLQKIRDHFGKPLDITSAYRCPSYNQSEGGATGSYHVKGMAADFVIDGVAPKEIAKFAESIGVLGIGLYSNFVHIDTRTTKYFWYGHEQSPRTTFGGATVQTQTNYGSSSSVSNSNNSGYIVGKTYKIQVGLAVRDGAGTNCKRKTYSQLTLNAKKNATAAGYLKKGATVTCLETKKIGNDIWMRIPSGWCAAYYNGEYYIK